MSDEDGTRQIAVRVFPKARRDEVVEEPSGRFVVRTTSPASRGKANRAVRSLVAAHLGVPPSRVDIVRGEHARDKVLRIKP